MNQLLGALLGVSLLLLQACASTPPLEARHSPSGLNSQFNSGQLPFVEYVASSRTMIAKVRADDGSPVSEDVVDGNAPFELKPAKHCPRGHNKPYRRGILLTHGLTDSPYFMRALADFFQANCFRVMAILLPGHGTRPGDLLEIDWHEWLKAEAYGTEQLAAEVDEIYLAGYSTGGALSIYQGLGDKRVRGLFLFSPALKISSLAALANAHKIYSWLSPSAKWLDITPDNGVYKYESFPKNAAAQIYYLTQALDKKLQQETLDIPVFSALSLDDTTVNSPATIAFMSRAKHPASAMVLYTTDTNTVPLGFDQKKIANGKLELVNSVIPAQKILSSAHTAIVLPAQDAHYGVHGKYANCAHYYPSEMEKYNMCKQHPENNLYGELSKENLQQGILQRLMYNPHFSTLEISMKRFISNLPSPAPE